MDTSSRHRRGFGASWWRCSGGDEVGGSSVEQGSEWTELTRVRCEKDFSGRVAVITEQNHGLFQACDGDLVMSYLSRLL